ncbi:hypothetical protein EDD85DRAFT_938360 [Armillaria nabsnona]|nr:hypothetical protein EDD85DRAFT_938360 [Armillaria nabsnona]
MNTEMDKLYRFRRIKAIELHNLPSEWDERSYYLNIFAGKHLKTCVEKAPGTTPTPKWTIDIDLSNIKGSKTFEVDVYCCEGDRSLGFYQASIGEIVIGKDNTINVDIQSKSSCPGLSLKIFREPATEIRQSAGEDQNIGISTPKGRRWSLRIFGHRNQDTSNLSGLQPGPTSVEDGYAIAKKAVEETSKPKEPSERVSNLINGVGTVKSMIDAVMDLHPAASIAWGIVSSGVDILKQQTELDKSVLRLYEAMVLTYKVASDDRLLWKQNKLEPIYKSLFQTTAECAMLIKRYIRRNRLKHIFSTRVTQKVEELIEDFAKLREQLDSGIAKDTLLVILGIRDKVDMLTMKALLQDIRPGKKLGPKSECMPGTRVETINTLVSWIAECDDRILWCSGLAGTGKSSLAGTLHNLLCFHMGSRSRLAAFVRYDRTSYSNSSELIPSIAHSLGMFDKRIGNAIAEALTASGIAVEIAPSQLRTQFQLLLQEPLETIPELHDEGPLVVIIDGLDESSDLSKDLLEVLADGFGPKLPYMRLIVFSRPEDKISRVFKNHKHVYHFPLDISSYEMKHDLQHFIQTKLDSITDKSAWEKHNEQGVATQLADRASGLFIWAATVCSFLCDFPSLPRLKALLETTIPTDAMDALTILYRTTLDTVASEVSGAKEDIRRCIRAVLGALIVRKGKMTVPMLPELVLQPGDPQAQLIVAKLGSVVEERSDGSLELIHKSFDDFLRDYGRCGDGWFIDVKEHEKELARRTTVLDRSYHAVPLHIQSYAVKVLQWHLDAFIELGIDTYRPLFESRYFLFWLEILYAFESPLPVEALFEVISVINAEVTDQSLRTNVYHAFTFWDRFTQFSEKYCRVNPAYVYTHAMSISPSKNFICRDWGQSSGADTPFNKERLLALIPCTRFTGETGSCSTPWLNMFKGSRHIQSEFIVRKHTSGLRKVPFYSGRSVLFDVDTGRMLDPSPLSILPCFPVLQFPSSYNASNPYEFFDASGQIIRLTYEIIERHNSDPHDAMLSNVDDDNNCNHRTDNSNTASTFISIANTQTSRCDNYLLPAIGGSDCPVVQYAHGLLIADKRSSLMLKVEPGTTGCRKWMTLDGGANWVDKFAVMEDGSRLLGLTGAAGKILLREWETSTDCPDFQYDQGFFRYQMSPDGSKVAVSQSWEHHQTYILGITSGSSKDIMDLMDARALAWFPDNKRIAYIQSWRCEHGLCEECCDLVVQCLASGHITTIHRWYNYAHCKVLVTPDGSRLITQDDKSSRTWDVSDL